MPFSHTKTHTLLLVFSLFVTLADPAFDPQAFKKFKKSGDKPVCLVNYQEKTVECNYKNMTECRDQYGQPGRHMVICFPRKSLKLDEDKKK